MTDQERIKAGKHVQEVKGLHPGQLRQIVLRGAQRAGLDGYLARVPLTSLELFGDLQDADGPFTGVHVRGTIQISARRVRGEDYGLPFQWGEVPAVSAAAGTPELSMQRTFVHELGHYQLFRLIEREGWAAIEDRVKPVFQAALEANRMVSRRGEFNWREYFCETFSASVYHRRELMRRDQAGYRMVQELRALLEVSDGGSGTETD